MPNDSRLEVRGLGPFTDIPLSRAIRHADLLHISGIVPMGNDGGVSGTIEEQTVVVLTRIAALMGEVGGSLDDLLSVRVYLAKAKHYAPMNGTYLGFFSAPFPARSCVVVGFVNPECFVVMEAVGRIPAS